MIGITYSLINIYNHYNEYQISESKYQQLTSIYQGDNTAKDEKYTEITKKSDAKDTLSQINDDYVGWLSVEGTYVEYPVVLGNDNAYYLNHNFYQETDKVGAVFMDYRNSRELLGKNTIIYGHNMKDDSMFGSLKRLLDISLANGQKIILDFQGKKYEWEIIVAYETFDEDWMQVEFESDAEYTHFFNNLDAGTELLPSENSLKKTDNVITLATCTPNDRNERLIVHGKLIKEA